MSGASTSRATIVDRSIHEDYRVFSYIHRELGNISDAEFERLGEFYANAISLIEPKEVNILVRCSRPEQQRRISFRSLDEQRMLTTDYLDGLDSAYTALESEVDFDHIFDSEEQDYFSVAEFILQHSKMGT